jgi:tetratricopeptide (TPR) repeat protein
MQNSLSTQSVANFQETPFDFEQTSAIQWDTLDRAEAYLNAGLVIEAHEMFEEVVNAGGPTRARWGLARCAYYRNDLHEALGHLQMLDPNEFPDLVNDLGVIYSKLGLVDRAREQLELAAIQQPGNPLPRRNLVDIYRSLENFEACAEHCRAYLELVPDDAEMVQLLQSLEA